MAGEEEGIIQHDWGAEPELTQSLLVAAAHRQTSQNHALCQSILKTNFQPCCQHALQQLDFTPLELLHLCNPSALLCMLTSSHPAPLVSFL